MPNLLHQHSNREPTIGHRWQLPSDHVPVAAEILGVRLASWNVLNTSYIHHISRGDQGLSASAIASEHAKILSASPFWSEREEHEVRLICEILKDCAVLCLQECSIEFLRRLERALPARCELRLSAKEAENQIATVIDRNRVELLSEGVEPQGFPSQQNRQIVNLFLCARPVADAFRLIHSHVPGNPNGPGVDELARYIRNAWDGRECCVVMGDLNFPETVILGALERAGLPAPLRASSDPTSLGTDGFPVKLDHILAFFGAGAVELKAISPGRLSPEFGAAANLLETLTVSKR